MSLHTLEIIFSSNDVANCCDDGEKTEYVDFEALTEAELEYVHNQFSAFLLNTRQSLAELRNDLPES